MRRILILFLLTATLFSAGCSAAQYHAGWCAYHVWRLEQDVQHHRLGWAAFQVVMATHHCKRAL